MKAERTLHETVVAILATLPKASDEEILNEWRSTAGPRAKQQAESRGVLAELVSIRRAAIHIASRPPGEKFATTARVIAALEKAEHKAVSRRVMAILTTHRLPDGSLTKDVIWGAIPATARDFDGRAGEFAQGASLLRAIFAFTQTNEHTRTIGEVINSRQFDRIIADIEAQAA